MIMKLSKKLFDKLCRPGYRHAYVEEHVKTAIAYQIRAMREQRQLSQADLGALMGKPQSVISRLEDPDYGKLTVQTLFEVAKALDVAFSIEYISFIEFIGKTRNVSMENLRVPSFSKDELALIVSFEQSNSVMLQSNQYVANFDVLCAYLDYTHPWQEITDAAVCDASIPATNLVSGSRHNFSMYSNTESALIETLDSSRTIN